MNIAERLRQLMQTKGLNQRQLSIAANIPYTTLDGICKKNCDNVKLTTLIKLADYFEISLDYLVGREDQLTIEEYQELKSYERYLEWRRNYGKT